MLIFWKNGLFLCGCLSFFQTQAQAVEINNQANSKPPISASKPNPALAPKATQIPIKNFLLEANPLLMVNQGLGIDGEFLIAHHVAGGFSVEGFVQRPYDRNNTQATRNTLTLAPYARYYFSSNQIQGFFVGNKVGLSYSKAEIKDSYLTASYTHFYIANSIHAGYRFVTPSQITIASYAGIGYKSSSGSFPAANTPSSRLENQDWHYALEQLNKRVNKIQPDFGLTIGYIF